VYKRILVPLEHSAYDEAILEHVRALATHCKAAVILIHVADGWAARNIHQLDLRESEEIQADRAYLEGIAAGLERDGFEADAILASGDPVREIAAATGISRPTVSTTLSRLAKSGEVVKAERGYRLSAATD